VIQGIDPFTDTSFAGLDFLTAADQTKTFRCQACDLAIRRHIGCPRAR